MFKKAPNLKFQNFATFGRFCFFVQNRFAVIMPSNAYANVFVYGTLKKGEPNHNWFKKAEDGHWKFVCDAQTTEKYPLIIATRYNIPFLLYKPGVGNYVKGEVYEVDEKVLANLDILEDHPNFYVREEYNVKPLDGSSENLKVWIYFIRDFKQELLNKTMYESYSSSDNHGLKYVTSEDSTLDDLKSA